MSADRPEPEESGPPGPVEPLEPGEPVELGEPVQPAESGTTVPSGLPVRPADAARSALSRARVEAARRGLRRTRPDPPGAAAAVDRPGPGLSGPGPDRHDPQPFGRALSDLVSERGWAAHQRAAGVLADWAQLVGPDVAAHTQAVRLTDGDLVVAADSTAWATQLRLLAPTLLARLAERVGAGVVRSITVSAPAAPSWRHGSRSVKGRGPRDTYG